MVAHRGRWYRSHDRIRADCRVGLAVYVSYVVPIEGFEWRYAGAILGIAALAMLAFQTADIYQVQAFRGYEKQYFRLASAWSVVFLLVISLTFFAKVGDHYSRLWLGGFYVAGLLLLLAFRAQCVPFGAPLDAARSARPPYRRRRCR